MAGRACQKDRFAGGGQLSIEIALAIVLGLAAIIEDLRRGTISNWIPVAAFVGGVISQVLDKGWAGFGAATLGAIAGFAVFLIFYLLGGMGGGDVKLMAGFGALLGAGRLLEAAIWTAGIGGLMALGVIGFSWLRARSKSGQEQVSAPKTIPYAPAIACGVWLALIPKG
jgi:prepilin peptidase CpaA